MFTSVYTKKLLSNAASNYKGMANKLQEDIDYAMNRGKTLNTEFSAEPVHEYSVTPITFSDTPDETPDEMSFGESEQSSDPFA